MHSLFGIESILTGLIIVLLIAPAYSAGAFQSDDIDAATRLFPQREQSGRGTLDGAARRKSVARTLSPLALSNIAGCAIRPGAERGG